MQVVLPRLAFLAATFLLALIAAFNQVKAEGLSWQQKRYLAPVFALGDPYHSATRDGILSRVIFQNTQNMVRSLGIQRSDRAAAVVLLVAFDFAFLLACAYYWRGLGVHPFVALFGLSWLAWAMTLINKGAPLAIGFWAAAALLVAFLGLSRSLLRSRLTLALATAAVSSLVCASPLALLPFIVEYRSFERTRKSVRIFLNETALGVLQLLWPLFIMYLALATSIMSGWAVAKANLQSLDWWMLLLGLLGVPALLAAFAPRPWPRPIAIGLLFTTMCAAPYLFSSDNAARLLLMPLAVALLPLALQAVQVAPAGTVATQQDAQPHA